MMAARVGLPPPAAPVPGVDGVVRWAPAGSGVDELRFCADVSVARALAEGLSAGPWDGWAPGVAEEMAGLLSGAEPATRGALAATPAAVSLVGRPGRSGHGLGDLVGVLVGGPGAREGTVVLPPGPGGADGTWLARAHCRLADGVGLPVALELEGGELRLAWPDGLSATLGEAGSRSLGVAHEGRLIVGARTGRWTVLNGVEPVDPTSEALQWDDPRLGPRLGAIEEGTALLAELWPEALMGVGRFVRAFRVLAPPDGRGSRSYTPRDLSGVLALSVHDPVQVADALVHEGAHAKFDLALWADDIVEDDGQAVHRVPWRPDPRPVTQVVYGIHAFLGVAELYRRIAAAQPSFDATAELLGGWAVQAWRSVAPAVRPTPLGSGLVEELESWVNEW